MSAEWLRGPAEDAGVCEPGRAVVYPEGSVRPEDAPEVDLAVVELNRRLWLVRDTVENPNYSADPTVQGNDVTSDALRACILLAHEHNPSRFGTVVDPRIARIILGWPLDGGAR